MSKKTAISPTREENYPEWYQEVVHVADLAEHSAVRGCMVIKPWGYALWENIQRILDGMFKETGHENAYFPLFIPLSFLEKEAQHVEGFAKECAVVTHHKLEKGPEGKLIPASPLEEPLVVRPTSETIIGATFAKWVKSYRDLPLLINQWANVVRWEMRTRLFLRTTEFLWQEGHTVHATKEEAVEETLRMLDVYYKFAHEYMAMPVIKGEKTENERFPGAVSTYTIEAMMQDGKALQAGTSHFLGQNFSKAAGIEFQSKAGILEYGWTTSWGMTTRMIGGLIMTHSDDDGLVMPPRVASCHVVIVPIMHQEESREAVLEVCRAMQSKLACVSYMGRPVQVKIDMRDMRAGDRMWEWIKKGVPVRVEVGPRDVAEGHVCVMRRDLPHKEMTKMGVEALVADIGNLLEKIQQNLYNKACAFQNTRTHCVETREDFYQFFSQKEGGMHGGFVYAHYCCDPVVEEEIKKDLNVTVRCLPLDQAQEAGRCIFTGRPSAQKALFARSY